MKNEHEMCRQQLNPLTWKTAVLVKVQKMAVMHQKIFVLLQLKQWKA